MFNRAQPPALACAYGGGMRVSTILLCGAAALAAAAAPVDGQAPKTPDFKVDVSGLIVADFTARINAYAELRRSLEKDIPALKLTDHPSDIAVAEAALAARIRAARSGARRGAIFTADIGGALTKVLASVTTDSICAAVRDDGPDEIDYRTNRTYPKTEPLSTVPPSILLALPALPTDVMYRFIGRALILHDTKANIILDIIPRALPCVRAQGF